MPRKHCGKRRNRPISPFSTVFSKDLHSRDLKPGLVWERVNMEKNVFDENAGKAYVPLLGFDFIFSRFAHFS